MERRFAIIDSRKGGDVFEDILPPETTEEEARKKLDDSWAYLTDSEKQRSTMDLVYIAVEDDKIVASDDSCYQEAVIKGWDTYAGYSPLASYPEND